MKWLTQRLVLILLILSALGCNSSTRSSETISPNTALFDPTTATVPLPNILATATAGDPLAQYLDPVTGRVGLRPDNVPMNPLEALAYVNLNEVGGTHAVSGLNAPIYLRFAASLVPETVTGANIKVFQISADSATPTATENNPLGFTDVTGMFSFRYTAGSREVQLFPNFPLLPGTRYLYLVTDRVKDAATGASVAGSVYFNALKSPLPLVGPFADLEQIRANRVVGGAVVLSGYAKVMDDLIATPAVSTVTSRSQIALIGRFITSTAGFLPRDPVNAPVASLIPVETALRAFAAGSDLGGLSGKSWLGAGLNTVAGPITLPGPTTLPAPATIPPQAFWTALGAGSAPASVAAVISGSFTSADISMNPMAVRRNAASMNQNIAFGSYSASTSVVQPFRSAGGQLTGFYYTERQVPFIYLVPAGTAPAGGWPVVIFQHGINGQKEQVAAVAGTLTAKGFAVVAIDLPLHGALAFPGHTASSLWGQDFMSVGAPLAARSNIQQAAFNLNRLELVLATPSFNPAFASLGFAPLGANAPNPAIKPKYLSLSLGSIVGAYYLAGNITLNPTAGQPPYTQTSLNGEMKGLFSVPGGRIAYLLQESPAFGPSLDAGLAAKGIAKGTPTYQQFFLLTQAVLDPVDPATMTTPLPNLQSTDLLPSRLSGRLLVQEATSTSFDATGAPTNGDLVIPNSSTRYFGNALGGRGVLGHDVAPGFSQLSYLTGGRVPAPFMFTLGGVVPTVPTPKTAAAASSASASGPVEGYFQFDQADATHGFLIDQTRSPASIQLVQRQMAYYLLTGLVVDPTVTSSALPKTLLRGAAGISGEVTVPPVLQIFGQP
jgi:hypothetical protein